MSGECFSAHFRYYYVCYNQINLISIVVSDDCKCFPPVFRFNHRVPKPLERITYRSFFLFINFFTYKRLYRTFKE